MAETLRRDSWDAGHSEQESRPLFRCGRSPLLWQRIPCSISCRKDHRRANRTVDFDQERWSGDFRRGLVQGVLQRTSHVLSASDISVLSKDLAAARAVFGSCGRDLIVWRYFD